MTEKKKWILGSVVIVFLTLLALYINVLTIIKNQLSVLGVVPSMVDSFKSFWKCH